MTKPVQDFAECTGRGIQISEHHYRPTECAHLIVICGVRLQVSEAVPVLFAVYAEALVFSHQFTPGSDPGHVLGNKVDRRRDHGVNARWS